MGQGEVAQRQKEGGEHTSEAELGETSSGEGVEDRSWGEGVIQMASTSQGFVRLLRRNM